MDQAIRITPSIWERIPLWIWRFAAAIGLQDDCRNRQNVFTEAVRDHDAMVRRICLGYSHSAEDLEDLYQDVMINVWQGLATYRADSSLKTWIYRIALNTCVSSLRQRCRRPNAVSLEDVVVNVMDNSEEKMQGIRELHESISMLGNIDKAVVMLWLDEYSYDEIATLTGLTRGNVATRLHRAKEKLKTIYDNGR